MGPVYVLSRSDWGQRVRVFADWADAASTAEFFDTYESGKESSGVWTSAGLVSRRRWTSPSKEPRQGLTWQIVKADVE